MKSLQDFLDSWSHNNPDKYKIGDDIFISINFTNLPTWVLKLIVTNDEKCIFLIVLSNLPQ